MSVPLAPPAAGMATRRVKRAMGVQAGTSPTYIRAIKYTSRCDARGVSASQRARICARARVCARSRRRRSPREI
jgi:hypothetical protein